MILPTGRINAGASRTLAYGIALLIGAAAVVSAFPAWSALWTMPPGSPRGADFAAQVLGQRYFLADGWHWPWLLAPGLDVPFGVNVAMTDSLPLLLLMLKPFAALLPDGFQCVTGWLALCWILQPAAAVFLLRSFGERRLLPALAAALFALATPSFLARIAHAPLCAHFAIMLALGLSLRIVDPGRTNDRPIAAAGLLLAALLLIHPYLMLMAATIMCAAPLTLIARGDRRWSAVTAWSVLSTAAVAGLAILLGYDGPQVSTNGFGIYSMNLLSPVWPSGSRLLDSLAIPMLDMTGGQYEGFQYLGAGVLLACVAAACLRPRQLIASAAHHPGLMAVCVALTLFAVSSRIFLGHDLLLSYKALSIEGVFRASGRLFWPVTYVIEMGSIALLARARHAGGLLTALALLQVYDASLWLATDRAQLNTIKPQPFDAPRLDRIVRDHDLVSVYPPWPCEATEPGTLHLMQVLWTVGRSVTPVNTIYTARPEHPPQCDVAAALRNRLDPGELVVLLQGHSALAADIPGASALCRRLGPLTVCTDTISALQGLAEIDPADRSALAGPAPAPALIADMAVPFGNTGAGNLMLISGWSAPEPWGTWNDGARAKLRLNLPTDWSGAALLKFRLRGYVPPGLAGQRVLVTARRQEVGRWMVSSSGPAEFELCVPPERRNGGSIVLNLLMPDAVSPRVAGISPDIRSLAIGLESVTLLDNAKPAQCSGFGAALRVGDAQGRARQ